MGDVCELSLQIALAGRDGRVQPLEKLAQYASGYATRYLTDVVLTSREPEGAANQAANPCQQHQRMTKAT